MKFKLEIKPAIPVETRHKIYDLLKSEGYDVWGTGQHMDGSACDITFDSKNPKDK